MMNVMMLGPVHATDHRRRSNSVTGAVGKALGKPRPVLACPSIHALRFGALRRARADDRHQQISRPMESSANVGPNR